MTAMIAMNTRGLNYLISADDPCPIRLFLFRMLKQGCERSFSMEQLVTWIDRPERDAVQLIKKMLELDWLRQVDGQEQEDGKASEARLGEILAQLSSTGEVVLADEQGLAIVATGFTENRVDELAAAASRLLSITETSRRRNKDLYNGQPWSVSMNWGSLKARAQYINLDDTKFVLILGGRSQLEGPAFFRLLASLAGRYTGER